MRGKLIVLYGVNNLGKTTQAKLLVEKLNSTGHRAKYLKYPVYDLAPSGPMINSYLREGNPQKLSHREAQMLYAMNRAQYESKLKEDLEQGFDIVAEDYWGTGVAWGVGAGVDQKFLLELNDHFLKEDLALLLVGIRIVPSFEDNHLHEQDEAFTNKVNQVHQDLGQQFGWKMIDAIGSIEEVRGRIWAIVEKII